MRIAIVTNIPTPYRKGFFAELGSCTGIQLTVFYCASSEPDRHWGDQVGSGYHSRILPGFSVHGRFHVNLAIPWEIRRGQFEGVVVGGYSYPSAVMAVLSARALGIPVIMWLDGPVGSNRAKLVKRILLREADAFIVTSARVVQSLREVGVPTTNYRIVPLTVDVGLWACLADQPVSERFQEVLGKGRGDRKVVTYCGRFIPAKNVDFVLELAYRLRDISDLLFLLIGDGPLSSLLMRRADQLGMQNVIFTGRVAPEQLPPILARSDILILPSLYEPWGAVVNEALATGTPVMVSNVAGAADLITHGRNGYVIDPRDVNQAERLLRAYLNEEALRVSMSKYALETGRRLTHRAAAERFADALADWVREK